MKDLISIIIPVYKVEKYLRECIDSVIHQTYKDIEVILVDDGSPDNCGKICDEYAKQDTRIKSIHIENGGVSKARNVGLDTATGKYVAFVDSDDIVDKNYILSMYESAIENDADFVISGYYNYFPEGNIKKVCFKNSFIVDVDPSNKDFVNFFKGVNNDKCLLGWVVNKLILKDICINIYFNESIKVGEDGIFAMRTMLAAKKISVIGACLYYYRINDLSIMHTYKEFLLKNLIATMPEMKEISSQISNKNGKTIFYTYYAWNVSAIFIHEIKYHKNGWRFRIGEVRKSEVYKYFQLKYILKLDGFKRRLKSLLVWLLVKMRFV